MLDAKTKTPLTGSMKTISFPVFEMLSFGVMGIIPYINKSVLILLTSIL